MACGYPHFSHLTYLTDGKTATFTIPHGKHFRGNSTAFAFLLSVIKHDTRNFTMWCIIAERLLWFTDEIFRPDYPTGTKISGTLAFLLIAVSGGSLRRLNLTEATGAFLSSPQALVMSIALLLWGVRHHISHRVRPVHRRGASRYHSYPSNQRQYILRRNLKKRHSLWKIECQTNFSLETGNC